MLLSLSKKICLIETEGGEVSLSDILIFTCLKMGFTLDVSRSLVQLFEDGCEVPFIARYRRHLTGNVSPDDLRHALETFNNAKYILPVCLFTEMVLLLKHLPWDWQIFICSYWLSRKWRHWWCLFVYLSQSTARLTSRQLLGNRETSGIAFVRLSSGHENNCQRVIFGMVSKRSSKPKTQSSPLPHISFEGESWHPLIAQVITPTGKSVDGSLLREFFKKQTENIRILYMLNTSVPTHQSVDELAKKVGFLVSSR